jgi:hypothetical protein
MKNPWLILPIWLLVYVVYRGACVATTSTLKQAGRNPGAIGAAFPNANRSGQVCHAGRKGSWVVRVCG